VQKAGELSPDGNNFWDGQRWMASLSPDGRWRWDGTNWMPTPLGSPLAQPAYAAPSVQGPVYASPVLVYRPPTNTMAVVSLVTGIISWFLCPFVGGIVAVISGHIGHGQIKQSGESGAGMATAGMVLGYIHLAAIILIAIFWLFVLGGTALLIGGSGAGHS
jgi:hypothetical protein